MKKAYQRESAILATPQENSLVKKVEVLVSPLATEVSEVVRGIEWFFTAGQGDRTFEAMWTHFALSITMED